MIPIVCFLIAISYTPSADQKSLVIDGNNDEVDQASYRNSGAYLSYEHIKVEKGIIKLLDSAFFGSSSLTSIELPTTLTYIGVSCFQSCTKLKSIAIPEGILSINVNTFRECESLESITLPSTLRSVAAEHTFYTDNNILKFEVDQNNPYFTTSDDGKILIENQTIAVNGAAGWKEITIPKEIEVIRRYFVNTAKIQKVIFEEGSKLYRIEDCAFRRSQIIEFVIPSGTQVLDYSILAETNVQTIFVPKSVRTQNNAFASLQSLTNLTIEEGCPAFTVKDGVVMDSESKTLIFFPTTTQRYVIPNTIKSVDYTIFRMSRFLTNLTTEKGHDKFLAIDNVLYTKDTSCLYCSIGLKKDVVVEAECEYVNSFAFANTLAERITFKGNKLNRILNGAFQNTEALKEIILPEGLEKIYQWCFSGCKVINITIPSSLYWIHEYCFASCTKVTSLNFEKCENMTEIPIGCFQYCNSLIDLKLPPKLINISSMALANTVSLKQITITANVKILSSSAFQSSSIEEILFESNENLKQIDENCFASSKLKKIIIPDSVEVIHTLALSNCQYLTSVSFSKSSKLKELKEDVIKGSNNIKEIFLGDYLESYSTGALGQSSNLVSISVSPNNPFFKDIIGILYSKNETVVFQFPAGLEDCVIEESVKEISNRAFYKSEKLKNIEFNDGSKLEFIGQSTFLGCTSIETLKFPNGLKKIGSEAFFGCHHLQEVEFGSRPILESIGSSSFASCIKIKSISVPTGTLRIEDSAFKGCESLSYVWLPSSLQQIGLMSFGDCQSLKMVLSCIPASNEGFSKAAFTGTSSDLSIYVKTSYKGSDLCGVRITRILDEQCQMPTALFSIGNEAENLSILCLFQIATVDDNTYKEHGNNKA